MLEILLPSRSGSADPLSESSYPPSSSSSELWAQKWKSLVDFRPFGWMTFFYYEREKTAKE